MYIQRNYHPGHNSFNVMASGMEFCAILNEMGEELFGQCYFSTTDEPNLFRITISDLTPEQSLAVMEAISCY